MINTFQTSRTEESRIALFNGADQHKWEELSKEAESKLLEMFSNGETLFEMCNYASDKRKNIAFELSHKQSSRFGAIRDEKLSDAYSPEKFGGAAPNLAALFAIIAMKNIICKHDRLGSYPVLISDKKYNRHHYVKSKNNEKEISLEMYVECENEDRFKIISHWPSMSKEKYDLVLAEFDSIRMAIFNENSQSDNILVLLGLLAYDLSNINLYKRGSASITGWIIRAIAKSKGFDLDGVLKVNGLPFDIYAQIQTREQYAVDFADAIKKQFNLQVISNGDKLLQNIQVDNEIINDELIVEFIKCYLLESIDSDHDKFIKIQDFFRQRNFKDYDALIVLAMKLNTSCHDFRMEYSNFLFNILETSCAINKKQKQRIEKYKHATSVICEMQKKTTILTEQDRKKAYFDVKCKFTNEENEVISIKGGCYELRTGYEGFHSIHKHKYALKKMLFENFGLPYYSLEEYLDPDCSKVTIPMKLLWTQESNTLCEKSPLPIVNMFDNQGSSCSSSSDNVILPTLGKRKRR